ncbi:MAG: acetylxylan esterase [Thermoguttaceae bacterium]|nr:acetylxylan esterase [Thermoguttaceae bacterium]MBR6481173.1 acetylxylan esterase [Thermoguttaceae bacterium]
MKNLFIVSVLAACAWTAAVCSDEWKENEDESKVVSYPLPDPLLCQDGTPVTTPELWTEKRRGEILEMFRMQMYGMMPDYDKSKFRWETLRVNPVALNGKAVFKEIRIWFDAPNARPKVDILVCIPRSAAGPVPAFLGFNFYGNHAVSDDRWISLADCPDGTRVQGKDLETQRGRSKTRWPIETIIDRGYALVTAYYEEIVPDCNNERSLGVYPLFASFEENLPEPSRAGAITAWAWGLSRILDCLENIPEIDAKRVAVMGHSRLGKTALWAGANDPRFALVISNDSGCGGAALSRRNFGETPEFMDQVIPYWFCQYYSRYAKDPTQIPFDQHELITLIAPRPVYVASADEDLWADPKGEFLSAWNADAVYRLLGTAGIGGIADVPPETNVPVGEVIRYHRRSGKHGVTDFDWNEYLNFADKYMK